MRIMMPTEKPMPAATPVPSPTHSANATPKVDRNARQQRQDDNRRVCSLQEATVRSVNDVDPALDVAPIGRRRRQQLR
jgi:hypothetical protein